MKTNKWIFLPWAIAAGCGASLITRTCSITKDGPFYIEQAQKLSADPISVIKEHQFGYPAMILAAHKIAELFGSGNGVYSWIISTQVMTVLCMLTAFVFIYLLAKNIIGSRDAFFTVLILTFLPYPARFGSDVLREWPNIMFLTAGMLAIVGGAKTGKWILFALAGLIAGLGYLVRAECAQVVVYGLIWLTFCLVQPKLGINRGKAVLAMAALLVCFAAIVLPYMHIKGQYLPEKMEQLIDDTDNAEASVENCEQLAHAGFAGGLIKSLLQTGQKIGENMMYYFFVFFLMGIYVRIKRYNERMNNIEKIIMGSFFAFNIIIVVLLYYNHGYMSRRHCLAMSVMGLLYVPGGLRTAAQLLEKKFNRTNPDKNANFWFYILLIIGFCICVPKLTQAKRTDREGFIKAAAWLAENTKQNALIAVPDMRISFYAERAGILAWERKDVKDADYAVAIVKNNQKKPDWGDEQITLAMNEKTRKKKIVIYKMRD